ncbi:MAG TPA: leucine-rich repeat protein [Clostridiales bacterium]|nr:MAG: hypothetical protein BWY37_01690 [Firmicutes bacterium ADurb.Bin262]HOU09308.1 leucine-rich repeat protein [Clostridiales bacterium]
MMKRTFVVSLVFIALFMFFDAAEIKVSADVTGDFTYTVSGSKATITDYSGTDSYLSIPGVLGAYTVSEIGNYAFQDCTGLTAVIIPASVTKIGSGAFERCYNLTSVTMSEGLVTIGNGAFIHCISLVSVRIPNSATSIGVASFRDCASLTSLILGKNLTEIADYAFTDCPKLYSVNIPANIKKIGIYTFMNCSGLISATIPNNVTLIGHDAFSGCPVLRIYCCESSYAQTYAYNHEIDYEPVLISSFQEGSGCVIDHLNGFIFGLTPGITSLDGIAEIEEGYHLSYIEGEGGFGTGTVVNIMQVGDVLASYFIVLYGDVNGDGNIDTGDAGLIVDFENFALAWDPAADAALYKAADLNGDGNIDSSDAGLIVDAENFLLTIDQVTGLAV